MVDSERVQDDLDRRLNLNEKYPRFKIIRLAVLNGETPEQSTIRVNRKAVKHLLKILWPLTAVCLVLWLLFVFAYPIETYHGSTVILSRFIPENLIGLSVEVSFQYMVNVSVPKSSNWTLFIVNVDLIEPVVWSNSTYVETLGFNSGTLLLPRSNIRGVVVWSSPSIAVYDVWLVGFTVLVAATVYVAFPLFDMVFEVLTTFMGNKMSKFARKVIHAF